MSRELLFTTLAWVILALGCDSGNKAPPGSDAAPADSASAREASVEDASVEDASALDASALDASTLDASALDASALDAGTATGACAVFGAPGQCLLLSDCAALGDHSSYAGHCPGPASIECCIKTPSTADNPPIPAGYKLMMQADVTPDMTTWAVAILNDPATYPMFSTTLRTFGALTVLARVEWHPPDFQNSAIHRGVTLYEPL